MFTSHSGVLALLGLAGLGAVVVLGGLFSYGSRHLRLVAEAEQYLAPTLSAETTTSPAEAGLVATTTVAN